MIIALIHGAPGTYGISFPDAPGCVSGGRTVSEAIARGREGLSLHLDALAEDNAAMPLLRDLDALRADPALTEDFAEAVMVVALDVDVQGRAVRVNITLDEGLLARIDRRVAELGETRSGFLATAAKARLAG
jgi:predicted RNase H-like HicB family nuclease